MGSLTSNKAFTHRAKDYAYFYNDNAEPTMHVEGIVEVAGASDINVDSTSISSGGMLVGKDSSATDGDFTVAYASATTLTLGGYPAGVSGFVADDIEFVRQIDANGAVTATYSRDDSDITAWDITTNTLTMTGATFAATDTFVIGTNVPRASTASGSSVGGGNNTYSNASGDFTATITDSTTNITITGLPFTLEAKHVVSGSIKKIDTSDTVTNVPLTDVAVSGGVITLADADNFATGDVVVVTLVGPDKAYDNSLDNQLTSVQNPNYAHNTYGSALISEDDLAEGDGGDGAGGAGDNFYYLVDMQTYRKASFNFLTTTGVGNTFTIDLFATENPDAVTSPDASVDLDSDAWENIASMHGNVAQITTAASQTNQVDRWELEVATRYLLVQVTVVDGGTADNSIDCWVSKIY